MPSIAPATAWAPKPGGVDHQRSLKPHRFSAARLDRHLAAFCPAGQDGGPERDHRSVGLGVAPQRQHQGVAVHDPGRRRKQGALGLQRRLERARLGAGQPHEVVDAVGPSLRLERCEPGRLGRVGRHDQLAAAPVGDGVGAGRNRTAALFLRRRAASWRVPSGNRSRRGRPRCCASSSPFRCLLRLDDDDLPPRARQRPGDRQPNDAGPDDETVDGIHAKAPSENGWMSPAPSRSLARLVGVGLRRQAQPGDRFRAM